MLNDFLSGKRSYMLLSLRDEKQIWSRGRRTGCQKRRGKSRREKKNKENRKILLRELIKWNEKVGKTDQRKVDKEWQKLRDRLEKQTRVRQKEKNEKGTALSRG